MKESELQSLIDVMVATQLWKAIIVFILTYILINLIKSIATSLFEFILIKTDVFGVGSYVDYKGKRGIIKEIGVRRIHIEMEDSDSTMYIRTLDWKHLILIIPDELKHKVKIKK